MRSPTCDLHAHTLHSDGALSPQALVSLAASRGVQALALTDHDSVDGIEEARAQGTAVGLEVVAGIELSVRHEERELHVLGYFVRHTEILGEPLASMRQARLERVERIVERLHHLGMPIDLEAVRRRARGRVVGRPHVADEMVSRGYVADVHTAFQRWLGTGKPAYLQRHALSFAQGVALLERAGAVPVLAHPEVSRGAGLIPSLARQGLRGLEVWHPTHDDEAVARYLQLARDLDLVPTGGSDFHRETPGGILPGDVGVTREELERLRDAAGWNGNA
ncbi:MAG: PHP domain-containing protein [Candidatus Latescibacterota bacterium]|nr:MAG: PHP domain-containing protein [Candidatus Latescibacterota bacterium]